MSDKEFNALTVLEQREARYFRVRFRRPIAAVNSDMQPKVMKEYIMKAVGSLNAQPVYIVPLENGRPLIVYKDEFEVLSLAEAPTSAELQYAM